MKKDTLIKRLFKTLLIIAGIALALITAFFAPIDRQHWKEKKSLVSDMENSIQGLGAADLTNGKLRAGWSKVSILPKEPIPIASYGIRENYKAVHDSVWCRTVVLDNGERKVAMVTLDLLIFPPVLAEQLKNVLNEKGYPAENTFFSASHTHNAPGGWAENLGGRFLAGKYNEVYVALLLQSVIESIELAEKNLEPASVGFGMYDAKEKISNRFSQKEKDLDKWLRVLKIRKVSGAQGAVVSYSAHPNILSSKIDEVSGDYAGELLLSLEENPEIEFAAFYAGAVGAHTCAGYKKENFEAITEVSGYLQKILMDNWNSIPMKDSVSLSSYRIPVYLGDPQLKISKNWKIRPWLFHFLLGEQQVFLSAIKIDNLVLVGTPCDFGGELVQNFSEVCEKRNLRLSITSFNGGYIGYIVPDNYYDTDKREARDMSWFGPYNAEYFTEIINRILSKI